MRNAVLYLALPLILLYFLGGSEALIEALTKVVALGSIQLITRYLDQSSRSPRSLKHIERHRLKK